MKRSLICLVFLTAMLGIFSSLWAQTTREVPSAYATIQLAIDAAVDGDIINVAAGTYLITSQINVYDNISIVGQGTVTIKANNPSWDSDNDEKHLISIYGGTVSSPVTISNITMDCNGQSYGLNTYNNAYGNLSDVTINNSKGAGLIVNGSTIIATNLNTSGNTWGAVNVDPGSGVTYPSVFTLVSGDLGENNQIWSDGAHVTAQATVTVTTPVGYSKYYVGDTTVCYWTNRDLENCATITRNNETRVYQTIQAAINAATAGDEINVAAGTYNVTQVNIDKPLTLNGANANIAYGDPARGPESIVQDLTSSDLPVFNVVSDGVTINGFEVTAPLSNSAIYCGNIGPSNLSIKYNYIHHIGNLRGSNNVYAINYRCANVNRTDINISYNYIDNVLNDTSIAEQSSAGIWIGQSPATGVYSNVLIEHNIIKNIHSYKGTLFGTDALNTSGINIGCGWKSTGYLDSPIIRYNTITDLSGYAVYGIALQGNTPGAAITNNTFTNLTPRSEPDFAAGLCIFQNIGYTTNNGTGINAHNNKFTNTHYGIYNATTNQVDGLSNWWGHATGPFHSTTNPGGLGNKVTDYVTYDPWFANEAGTQFDSNAPVENVTQNTFYNTIQAAVNAANEGDLINISAGTYPENVVVNTRLTLQGAGPELTTITATNTVLALGAGTDATHRMIVKNLKVTGGTTGLTASSYTTLENILSTVNTTHGILLNPLTDLIITNCSFNYNLLGLKLATQTAASYITITGSHFDNNSQGWYSESSITTLPALDHLNITNTTFNYNGKKGIYTDRLSNSTFDNITVIGSGCESNYAPGAGVDINLKYQNFSNITIKNSTISGCGIGNTNGVGLAIKARDDGNYANPSATLSNVTIDAVTLTGNKTGLAFGEPGQNNAGPTAVVIKNCIFNNLEMDINNFSTSAKDALLNNTFTGAIDNFAIESRIYHKVDNSLKGLVTWVEDTVYVPPTITIQAGIDAATEGDEIEVASGTYLESIIIDKAVTLKSTTRDLPIINGGESGSVVTIAADGVTLQGFQIQNSGSGAADAGVMLNGFDNCHIIGNTVLDNANGIILAQGNANEVKQNIVTGNDFYGIALVAETGSTLELNNLSGNGLDAIAVENANKLGGPVSAGSTANVIKTNTISSNQDGIFLGENCNSNIIGGSVAADGNTVTATRNGIHLWKGGTNTASYNVISGCEAAFRLIGSDGNTISHNTMNANATALKFVRSGSSGYLLCENNTVTGNAFGTNDIQVNGYQLDVAPNPLYDGPSTDFADMTHLVALNTWPGGSFVVEPYYIYGNGAEVLYVDAVNTLIKDAETQTYHVKALYVQDLTGFTIEVKFPKAYFDAPTSITAATGIDFLEWEIVADDNYHRYMVTGAHLEPMNGLDLVNQDLFTVEIASKADPTNAWVTPIVTMIDLPLASVILRDHQQPPLSIPCLGTLEKNIIIDSGEPTMAVIPELSGQPLPTVIPPTNQIDPTYLTLSFGDNYNLDFVKYLIQPQTYPSTVPVLGDFGTDVASLIDGMLWNNGGTAWEIPNGVLNALADGTYEIFFLAMDDAGNSYINPTPWVFIIDKTAPTAITWVKCLTTPDADNSVDLEWTGNGSKYDVWCLNYSSLTDAGAYPLYNPASFTPPLPAAPNAYNGAAQNNWTQLANNVTTSAYTHHPGTRGYYYYYVFAEDASGNIGPVSELRESISYWPGDVVAPLGTVDSDDITALSAVWSTVPLLTSETNVGPAVGNMRRSRRTPDDRYNIDDLMMFAMNYQNTDYTVYDRVIPELNPIRIEMISQLVGDQLIVSLNLGSNNGFVKGLNIPILYGSGLSLLSVENGSVWPENSILLQRNADNVVELSASTLGDEIVEGNGLIATLTFSISGTDSNLELQHMIARTIENSEIEIIDNPQETPSGNEDPESIIPVTSYLGANYPNPFNPSTTIQFGLNQTEQVRLSIFNARGQMVKTLVNGVMSAGIHNVVWNGMDNNNRALGSGIYFYRMETKNYSETKKAILIK